MTKLSPHFTRHELACPTTGDVVMQKGFLDALEALRVAYAHPMIVTSGCRSREHNDWLRRRGYPASPNSLHLIGNQLYGTQTCAVDIARPNGIDLHTLIRIATASLWAIGIAETFIHLDRRADYTDLEPVVYSYQ